MDSFADLNLDPALQRAIKDLGFEKPSPIQAQTLPILLGEPTDFIGLAATGTGKTAAFCIPLLQALDPNLKSVQAIILCPTRELCLQVSGQVNLLSKYLGFQSLAVYGGAPYGEQLRGLKRGVAIVVGTPGRVIDHINRGTLKLGDVRITVLDEADEMISMGFREAMETILESISREQSRTWLFSATMSPAIRRVSEDFLVNPRKVEVNRTEVLSTTVKQSYFVTQEKNKPEVLCKLIDAAEDFYGLVFCQTKDLVINLTEYLNERGYKAACLHGDMNQSAREVAMQAFRDRKVRVMIGTDVAARGIDVKDVTHVINYSLPRELDSYVHRIGRTARSGKAGIAMSLVTPSHRHLVQKIERMTRSRMEQAEVPSRKTIGLKKVSKVLTDFSEQSNFAKALELMGDSWKTAVADMSSEEVAARFLTMMHPWVLTSAEPVFQLPQASDQAPRSSQSQRPRSSQSNSQSRSHQSSRSHQPSRSGYSARSNQTRR